MIRTHYIRGKSPSGVKFTLPSLVQSHLQSSTDINDMIRRACMGDSSVFRHPRFMDVLDSPDSFHDALNRVRLADCIWDDLPESLKQSFGSPERLLDYIDSSDRVKSDVSPTPAKQDDNPQSPTVTPKGDAPSTVAAHASTT